MNRRTFLKSLSISGTSLWLAPALSAESSIVKKYLSEHEGAFVLIVVKGGMDVTLGLDPWIKLPEGIDDKDIFIEYTSDQVSSPTKGMLLGPAARGLAPHAKDCAIINGIFQNDIDNGHDVNLQYIKTGNGLGLAPSAPVTAADYFGQSPLGLLLLDSKPVLGSKKLSTTSVEDVRMWAMGNDLSSVLKAQANTVSQNNSDLILSQKAVIELGPYRKKIVTKFNKLNASSKILSDNFDEIRTLMACLGSAASKLAEIEIRPRNESLDTHQNHIKRHLAGQTDVWNQISEVFQLAKKTQYKNSPSSVFDKTTFLVVSDFGRTPYLNSNEGKDHNPNTNSVLIAGRGVRGGQVIGKSLIVSRKKSVKLESVHIGAPINFKTFQILEALYKTSHDDFDFIGPENVMATVFRCIGLSPESMGLIKGVPALTKIVKA